MHSANKNSGFTLVELMVVVAILGFLALAATRLLGNTGNWISQYRLKAAARQMAVNLEYARMEAIKRNRTCALAFNQEISGTTYNYVVFVDVDFDTTNYLKIDADDTVLLKASFTDGVTFDTTQGEGTGLTFPANDSSVACVGFDPRGLRRLYPKDAADATDKAAYLTDSFGNKVTIVVSNTGKVKVK